MAAAAVQIAPVLSITNPQLGTKTEPRVPKHDVTTTLNYYKPNADGSDPAPAYVNDPTSFYREPDPQEVSIKDIAGEEANYSLDRNGFQVHHQPATERDFIDEDKIKTTYYAETEKLLKDVTGADRIFIFDHTIRRRGTGTPDEPAVRGPVQQVHIDQSYKASLSRVPHHLPDEADQLVKGRVQIINVWRPIKTIERDPLAVADAHSVEESDLVTRGLIYPTRQGETYSVKHNKNHRWHYRSGLTPEQVLLIKCFDSKTDGRARRVPHTAFVDPSSPSDAPPRESIEVRALVFHTTDRE